MVVPEWYDASERRVKKPGKPKPRRRTGVPRAVPAAASAMPGAVSGSSLPAIPASVPSSIPSVVASHASVRGPVPPRGYHVDVRGGRPRASSVVPVSAHDDRAAFALLMVPFLLVGLALGSAQMRRTPLPMPDLALVKPDQRVAVSLPATMPAPLPPSPPMPPAVAIPGPAPSYPPPVPEITAAASLDLRPAPLPMVAPAPSPMPQVAIAYPPPAPEITVDLPFVPPVAISYPPTMPEITFDLPAVVPTIAIAYPPIPPDIAPLLPPPLAPVVPPSALVYPPAVPEIVVEPPPLVPPIDLAYSPVVPEITVASLDIRPPLPPVAPSLPVDMPRAGEGVCTASPAQLAAFGSTGRLARATRQPRVVGLDAETFGRRLASAALQQTRDFVIYSARYQAMAYPMGDVMGLHGACIDVVIRAYRALGIDLQEEVQKARGTRGDPNIDHRRTENVRRFLERHGTSLPITAFPENYKPGDIVTYHRPHSRVSTSHIAIVTDVLAPTGRPMIVHNRGYGAQLEDALFVDRITGHYRYMGPPVVNAAEPKGRAPDGDVVRASFKGR
jgi:uncharacterized protein YijF (DUF1287 family)